jgi:hypothetical protein
VARRTAEHRLDQQAHRRVAHDGARTLALARVDRQSPGAGIFASTADTPVIVREVLGVAALVASALVPLWAARAVLGTILAFLKWRETPHEG